MSGAAAAATLHVLGGFAFADIIPALPPAPLLTGELQLGFAITADVELRARYATYLGLTHRVGPDLRLVLLRAGRSWLGARLHPSALIGGTPDDVAGDLSTQAALTAGLGAVHIEAGITVQWLVFDPAGSDGDPYLAFVDLAVEARHQLAAGTAFVGRLEIAVPTARDDPFAVLGVHPRLLAGVVLSL